MPALVDLEEKSIIAFDKFCQLKQYKQAKLLIAEYGYRKKKCREYFLLKVTTTVYYRV